MGIILKFFGEELHSIAISSVYSLRRRVVFSETSEHITSQHNIYERTTTILRGPSLCSFCVHGHSAMSHANFRGNEKMYRRYAEASGNTTTCLLPSSTIHQKLISYLVNVQNHINEQIQFIQKLQTAYLIHPSLYNAMQRDLDLSLWIL